MSDISDLINSVHVVQNLKLFYMFAAVNICFNNNDLIFQVKTEEKTHKMVNYILSFCKITAASRIFSRNFYLPLLKPLTPKDALRTFRITGKWLLGAKSQHYIPVLLNHKDKRSKNVKDYGKKSHVPTDDYSYMIPIFDPENESHRILLAILENKEGDDHFVYTVDDKRCNVVLSSSLESAIREGEVVDVLISQRNDKILVKLKNFKKIPLEMETFSAENKVIYNGEGSTSPEEEKFHHHGKFTMSIAKIFEDKEREAEEWELELKRIMTRKRKQRGEGTKEWNEMIRVTIKNLDWKKFEKDAKKIVDQIGEPVVEQHIGMEVYDLENTRKVPEVLTAHGLHILPTLAEIPDVVNCMSNAKLHEIEADIDEEIEIETEDGIISETRKVKRKITGVWLTLTSGKECFISGQMVKTDDGDVFVPGQTIETEFGLEYSPGFTVNIDSSPSLIKGLIMGEDSQEKPMFLPTESTITSDGQLSFATTTEERIKYKPIKRAFKLKRRKPKNKLTEVSSNLEDNSEQVDADMDDIDSEVFENENDYEANIPQVPITPVLEVDLDDLLQNYLENNDESEISDDIYYKELDDTLDSPLTFDQKQEWEQLMQELMDDGMDDLISSIEDKKLSLEKKLAELRKIKFKRDETIESHVTIEDINTLIENINIPHDRRHDISEFLLMLTRRVANIKDKKSINAENIRNPYYSSSFETETESKYFSSSESLKVALKSAAVALNDAFKIRPKDQQTAAKSMSGVCLNLLDDKTQIEICNLANTPLQRNDVCSAVVKDLTQNLSENKVEILKKALSEEYLESLPKILQVIENEVDLSPAFSKICKCSPYLIKEVVDILKIKINRVKSESSAIEMTRDAILSVAQKYSEDCLINVSDNYDYEETKLFLEEGACFAKALGLVDVCDTLSNLACSDEIDIYTCEKQALTFLKRLCIIRKLTEKDYYLKTAVERLMRNVEAGKTDLRIRQLIRESAVLLTVASPLKTSKELPLQILKVGNLLAIEDFLAQRIKMDCPILITKNGMQAIIPRESEKSVTSGRVAYILVDETGISNFKPMHMLTALKLSKPSERSFDDLTVSSDRERRSQSPFVSTSRGSSPQTNGDVKKRYKRQLTNGRMVA